jgi:hypothetical protein
VDKAWEQKKLKAREMLKNGDESHLSSARFVGLRYFKSSQLSKPSRQLSLYFYTTRLHGQRIFLKIFPLLYLHWMTIFMEDTQYNHPHDPRPL